MINIQTTFKYNCRLSNEITIKSVGIIISKDLSDYKLGEICVLRYS